MVTKGFPTSYTPAKCKKGWCPQFYWPKTVTPQCSNCRGSWWSVGISKKQLLHIVSWTNCKPPPLVHTRNIGKSHIIKKPSFFSTKKDSTPRQLPQFPWFFVWNWGFGIQTKLVSWIFDFFPFWPFFGPFQADICQKLKNSTFFCAKRAQKMGQHGKISKIQETSFVCILKSQFHAKNEGNWGNWRRVESFFVPKNGNFLRGLFLYGISYTFSIFRENTLHVCGRQN